MGSGARSLCPVSRDMVRNRKFFMPKLYSKLIALVIFAVTCMSIAGQTSAPVPRKPAATTIKRMPDGHPDLEGMYDLATLTPIERPAGAKAVLSEAEAAALEKGVAALKV